jgi:7-cyano-7-deazaguanine reductase
MSETYENLTLLGQHVPPAATPEAATLERVPNPHPDTQYLVRFTCPEFTSLCPLTGQPDFAHIVIDYLPKSWLVESKSLKIYLAAFRNHGAFHEACSLDIAKRLVALLDPAWLRIGAYDLTNVETESHSTTVETTEPVRADHGGGDERKR